MFDEILKNVALRHPVVHCITNYVTVNDCANVLLACGASPIMADDEAEAEEITSICSGLTINIGTLNSRTLVSMAKAGAMSNSLDHPVILDPVGAGASSFRTSSALDLIEKVKFSVIRGNISEIKTISSGCGRTRGVDADENDILSGGNIIDAAALAKEVSLRLNLVTVITGESDIITDGKKVYAVKNGHKMMSKVTGTGCMLSALTTAFCAANSTCLLDASAAAAAVMGLCGELAYKKVQISGGGTSSFRTALIDEISLMDEDKLNRGIKIEVLC